ncbi:MAG: flavodoxin domain-containing protein [Vicinamibacterales bacterium]
MCEVPVFYATSEGQTRRIAERLADELRAHGLDAVALEIGTPEADQFDWSRVRGALLGASLHIGKHQRKATAFARRHRDALTAHPSAFFSVCLSAASSDPVEVKSARALAAAFADATGWHPGHIVCFAGRLAYTQYNPLVRFLMKRIAGRHGAPTDTNRDYELTRWDEVTHLAEEMADDVRASR